MAGPVASRPLDRANLGTGGRDGRPPVYVYPTIDPASGALVTAETTPVPESMRYLYRFLLENRYIEGLENYDPSILRIDTRDVLARLQRGDAGWESAVPERVAAIIEERRLFLEHAT